MPPQERPPPPASGLYAVTGRYLPDLVFGANDGVITTLAVVSGVVGASLSPTVVLILGFANLFADGFSMGASNFLSRRSDAQGGELPTLAAAASIRFCGLIFRLPRALLGPAKPVPAFQAAKCSTKRLSVRLTDIESSAGSVSPDISSGF